MSKRVDLTKLLNVVYVVEPPSKKLLAIAKKHAPRRPDYTFVRDNDEAGESPPPPATV